MFDLLDEIKQAQTAVAVAEPENVQAASVVVEPEPEPWSEENALNFAVDSFKQGKTDAEVKTAILNEVEGIEDQEIDRLIAAAHKAIAV